MLNKKIVRNAIKCRHCLDVIESTNVHDFKYCSCKKVGIDGGFDYLKRLGEPADYEEMSNWTEE